MNKRSIFHVYMLHEEQVRVGFKWLDEFEPRLPEPPAAENDE